MGLDTTYGAYNGGYGHFMIWRKAIAKAVGIPLELMEGFYKPCLSPSCKYPACRDMAKEMAELLPIKWELLKPDVICVLLDHSDCDGEIPYEYTKPLADRLKEILPLLPEDVPIGIWLKKTTQQFIDGLMEAHEAHDSVEFE